MVKKIVWNYDYLKKNTCKNEHLNNLKHNDVYLR